MKNTEVAKIAKKITKKSMIPAYITPAGAIVAFNDDASILFTAEVEAALQDTGKAYTPAAVDYSEAYAREHKDIINQMQKARGHIYNSGVELIAAVYTIQNGGITA